jgi:hypothetical protein
MANYQKAKIYKIISDKTNLIYYGSTTQKLSQRMAKHRYDYKRYLKNNKIYCYSSLIFNLDQNAIIILVEKFPCEDIEQLKAQERIYIQNNKCCNKYIPSRTIKEWKEDNPNYYKNWLIKNRKKRNEYQNQYYKNQRLKEKLLKNTIKELYAIEI